MNEISRKIEDLSIQKICPWCKKILRARIGKYGKLLSCSDNPDCNYIYNLNNFTNLACPLCSNRLKVRFGKYGHFLGCSEYPKCDFIIQFKDQNIICPRCNNLMKVRTGQYNKFLSCSNYPNCNFTYNFKSSKLASLLNLELLSNSQEETIYFILQKIELLKDDLKINPTTLKILVDIFIAITLKKITMGRSMDQLFAASLLCASRINGFTVLYEEIAKITKIPKKLIRKIYYLIVREVLPDLNLSPKRISLLDYIRKFSHELGLSEKCLNHSIEIIESINNSDFVNRSVDPRGIAGAVIYISSKANYERKTQSMISKVTKVTEVTLRNRIRELKEFV